MKNASIHINVYNKCNISFVQQLYRAGWWCNKDKYRQVTNQTQFPFFSCTWISVIPFWPPCNVFTSDLKCLLHSKWVMALVQGIGSRYIASNTNRCYISVHCKLNLALCGDSLILYIAYAHYSVGGQYHPNFLCKRSSKLYW